jgi:AcrR family transcriptional regulator
VAKATFYRYFPSKDELIVAWLEDPRTRWFDRVRVTAEARPSTPGELIPRLFEAIAEWLETDDFLGCPYLHTSVEVTDPSRPASQTVRAYLAEVGTYLEERARRPAIPTPHVWAGSCTLSWRARSRWGSLIGQAHSPSPPATRPTSFSTLERDESMPDSGQDCSWGERPPAADLGWTRVTSLLAVRTTLRLS